MGFSCTESSGLTAVYRGDSATLRLLRALGWGPELLNLGSYSIRGPFNFLNLLPSRVRIKAAQERLVQDAAALLAPRPGERLLDIACGRGWAAYYLATAHPGVEVNAVDLLGSNIQVAKSLFSSCRGLAFAVADATRLPFSDQTFDRALCLEAAFHFQDKAAFLKESARVLKPGGRLAIIDFLWRPGARARVQDDERTQLLRQIWGFQDFLEEGEYRALADAAGFVVIDSHDWSHRVTRPLQGQFDSLVRCAQTTLGRRLLARFNPLLRSVTKREWSELAESAAAHRFVRSHSLYGALLMQRRH